jgi:signal transduction histidine kinase
VSAVTAPAQALELRRRVVDALLSLLYTTAGLPLGTLYLVVLVAGLAVGISLSILVVGVPIVLAVLVVSWQAAGVERALANRLLHAQIPPLRRRARSGSTLRRIFDHATSASTWRALGLLLLRLPVATLSFVLAVVPLALAVALVIYGAKGMLVPDAQTYVGPWALERPVGGLLLVLSLPAMIVSIAMLDGLGSMQRGVARLFLGSPHAAGGAVREVLAESLGDRTVDIAYWLGDRELFVDEHGHPVTLPEPGSGRSWTAVETDGRRVAAIIHDAELDAGPDLVQAAASAAVLAIENEYLKADLRARVEELRASRARLVRAGDAARKRLERDLHDGAQQHLVALSLDLQLLRRRMDEDPASKDLVQGAIDKLTTALAELRELARGIHPAILTDRGLEAALLALAERTPIPVVSTIKIDRRISPTVEAACYFVVSEALTNIVKYAQAQDVTVRVALDGDALDVEIADDGVGGAVIGGGSGLRGLQDRLGALDGTLAISSLPGQGTRVSARIPLGEAEGVTAPTL